MIKVAAVAGAIASVALVGSVLAQQVPTRDASTTPTPLRTGTASIAGILVDAVSGAPIRRATVVAGEQTAGVAGRMTVTGDDGRFAFTSLPAGRYLLTAGKAAYLSTAYGVKRAMRPGSVPTGSAIALTDGLQMNDVELRMTRGAVMTGVVRAPDGQPVRGAYVSLSYFIRAPLTGDRTLATVPSTGGSTDSRGVYRIFGIPPGEYVASVRLSQESANLRISDLESTTEADVRRVTDIAAARAAGRAAGPAPITNSPAPTSPRRPTYGYATVFHPGTSSLSQAALLTLGPGEERTGIDFRLQLVPQSRVSGIVTGPDGRPVPNVTVRLSEPVAYHAGPFLTWLTAFTDPQGQYTIRGVPAGEYAVEIRPVAGRGLPPNPVTTAWARTTVSVTGNDDAHLNFTLQPGRTVSGQITIDPAATGAPADLTRARVTLMNRDGLQTVAVVTPDGRFTIAGVMPDAYRLTVAVPGTPPATAWFPRSGTIGSRDALDAMIDVTDDVTNAAIVLTTRVSEVSGSILDGTGRPAPEYFLVIFPADKTLWTWQSRRIQQARPASDGRFIFRNLPAGAYLLGAVTDLESSQVYEPALLAELAGVSVKFTLAEGEKKTQDIRLK